MDEVTLALDWTPNTNHVGFYAAAARGEFEDRDLDVEFRSPASDDYEATPAKLLARGEVDFAIAPSESAISYHTHPGYEDLVAVATVLQRDTSAIVTLEKSGIDRPRDLDGRTYASYDARFEDHIVEAMVRADGGEGDVEIVTPPKLGIWNTLLEGEADATWVFVPWEGLLAEREGVELNPFYLDDYGIPYGYTPLVLTHPDRITDEESAARDFLAAASAGHEFAAENPEAAAGLLYETARIPDVDDREFVEESTRRLADEFLGDGGDWGTMERERWVEFVDWLDDEGILTDLEGERIPADEVAVGDLYDASLLPA
jgi:ABC-type nitrate/sulfonate/bicarbonate transport system substrate-binding protein